MTVWFQHKNNVQAMVAQARSAGDPTITLDNAALFGQPTLLAPVRISVRRGNIPLCILKCTGISDNTCTITGPIEGTTDQDMQLGDNAWLTVTASDLDDIESAIDSITGLTGFPKTYTFLLGVGTPIITGTNLTNALIVTKTATITSASIYAKTAPNAQDLVIQVNANGLPIWNNPNRLTLPAGSNFASITTFDLPVLSPNTLLTIDVVQASGQDATLEIETRSS